MEFKTEVLDWLKKCEKRFQKISASYRTQDLEQVREACMKQLRTVAEESYKEAVRHVYMINRDRVNSIRLQNLLDSIRVTDEGKWGISVFIDESNIDFHDGRGEPIYKIMLGYDFMEDNSDRLVRSLNDHWRTPIGGISEDRYIVQEASHKIEVYIHSEFISFVEKELSRVKRGGK